MPESNLISVSIPDLNIAQYSFVIIDSDYQVSLAMPIIGGYSIGTDNTCKTVDSIKKFYGDDDVDSASRQLADLREKLEIRRSFFLDIDNLDSGNDAQITIIGRQINQISTLLTNLEILKSIEYRELANLRLTPYLLEYLNYDQNIINIYRVSLRPFVRDFSGYLGKDRYSFSTLFDGDNPPPHTDEVAKPTNLTELIAQLNGPNQSKLLLTIAQKLQNLTYDSSIGNEQFDVTSLVQLLAELSLQAGLFSYHKKEDGNLTFSSKESTLTEDQAKEIFINSLNLVCNILKTKLSSPDQSEDTKAKIDKLLKKLLKDPTRADNEFRIPLDNFWDSLKVSLFGQSKYELDEFIQLILYQAYSIEDQDEVTQNPFYATSYSPADSPQESFEKKGKLAIILQFYLASLNLELIHKLGLRVDIGDVLEKNDRLRLRLFGAIFPSDGLGKNFRKKTVEAVIKDFFKNNKQELNIKDITDQELDAVFTVVDKEFIANFNMIKESEHFDNFWFLKPKKDALGFSNAGNICIDFQGYIEWLNTKDYPTLPLDQLKLGTIKCQDDKTTGLTEDVKVSKINKISYQIKPEDAIKKIIACFEQPDKLLLSKFLDLLMGETDDGKILLENEEIKKGLQDHFRLHPLNKRLLLQVAQQHLLSTPDKLATLTKALLPKKKVIMLTKKQLNTLKIKNSSNVHFLRTFLDGKIENIEKFKSFLSGIYGIEIDKISFNSQGSAFIEVKEAYFKRKIEKFKTLDQDSQFAENQDSTFISIASAAKIYASADARSANWRNGLKNDKEPLLLRSALTTLQINFIESSKLSDGIPGSDPRGFIVKFSEESDLKKYEQVVSHEVEMSEANFQKLITVFNLLCADKVQIEFQSKLSTQDQHKRVKFILNSLGINPISIDPATDGCKIFVDSETNSFFDYLILTKTLSKNDTINEFLRIKSNLTGIEQKALLGEFVDELKDRIIKRPTVEIQQLISARFNDLLPLSATSSQVKIYCPDRVLEEFKKTLEGTGVLGIEINDPYSPVTKIKIPDSANDLTAYHLHILARNENVNTDGIMKTGLYHELLDDDQIARIRCLVKATTIVGLAGYKKFGGYPHNKPIMKLDSSNQVIIIDQSGYQWQKDHYNTGSLFFYPDNTRDENFHIKDEFDQYTRDMFQATIGRQRPPNISSNTVDVEWMKVKGKIDLDQLAMGIKEEFIQAFSSAINASELLDPDKKICFKFLKAGMGFFSSGISCNSELTVIQEISNAIEQARIQGIIDGLKELKKQYFISGKSKEFFKKVEAIEFPFTFEISLSSDLTDAKHKSEQELKTLVQELGLILIEKRVNESDVFYPRDGYVIATTNTGDPHAFLGNEGGYESVDAAISSNLDNPNLFNPVINTELQKAEQHTVFAQSSQSIVSLDQTEEIKLSDQAQTKIIKHTPELSFKGIKFSDDKLSFSHQKLSDQDNARDIICETLHSTANNLITNYQKKFPQLDAEFFCCIMQISRINSGLKTISDDDLKDMISQCTGKDCSDELMVIATEFSAIFQENMKSKKFYTGRVTNQSVLDQLTGMRLFRASTDENILELFKKLNTAPDKESFEDKLKENYQILSDFKYVHRLSPMASVRLSGDSTGIEI